MLFVDCFVSVYLVRSNKNHSYDHSSFTYRALFVTVFALMAMIVKNKEKLTESDFYFTFSAHNIIDFHK